LVILITTPATCPRTAVPYLISRYIGPSLVVHSRNVSRNNIKGGLLEPEPPPWQVFTRQSQVKDRSMHLQVTPAPHVALVTCTLEHKPLSTVLTNSLVILLICNESLIASKVQNENELLPLYPPVPPKLPLKT